MRQELAETLYHVLWELVHVFFDHRGLLEGRERRDVARLRRLGVPLPLPGRGAARPGGRASRTSARSVLMKAEEVAALRAADAAREPRRAGGGGRRRCARASTAAGRCWRWATAARRPTPRMRWPTCARPRQGWPARARARPGRGPLDHHRDRQRRRRGGDLRPPGHRPRPPRRRRARALHQRQLGQRHRGPRRGAPPRAAHGGDGGLRRGAGGRTRGWPTTSW